LKQGELLEEEARLMAAAVPTSSWPAHLPGRRRFDEYRAQVEAAERQEYETRRTVQLLEYEFAAAAAVPHHHHRGGEGSGGGGAEPSPSHWKFH
jgi:hypothetical protein